MVIIVAVIVVADIVFIVKVVNVAVEFHVKHITEKNVNRIKDCRLSHEFCFFNGFDIDFQWLHNGCIMDSPIVESAIIMWNIWIVFPSFIE